METHKLQGKVTGLCMSRKGQIVSTIEVPDPLYAVSRAQDVFHIVANLPLGAAVTVTVEVREAPTGCECGHGKFNHATEHGSACLIGDCLCQEFRGYLDV